MTYSNINLTMNLFKNTNVNFYWFTESLSRGRCFWCSKSFL